MNHLSTHIYLLTILSLLHTVVSAQSTSLLQTAKSGKCLGAVLSNGSKLKTTTCDPFSTSQTWQFRPSVAKANTLLRTSNDLCLDLTDGKAVNGQKVQVWKCSSSNVNQFWNRVNNNIRFAATNYCLDVPDGTASGFADGKVLQIWKCDFNNPNQRFIGPGPVAFTTSTSTSSKSSSTTTTSSKSTSTTTSKAISTTSKPTSSATPAQSTTSKSTSSAPKSTSTSSSTSSTTARSTTSSSTLDPTPPKSTPPLLSSTTTLPITTSTKPTTTSSSTAKVTGSTATRSSTFLSTTSTRTSTSVSTKTSSSTTSAALPTATIAKPALTSVFNPSAKRMLAWGYDNRVAGTISSGPLISTYHHWEDLPVPQMNAKMKYIANYWGATKTTQWEKVKAALGSNIPVAVAGFNEPDIPSQANMTVDAAAKSFYNDIDQVYGRLGSLMIAPAVAWDVDNWLVPFMKKCKSLGCDIDAVGFHIYLDLNDDVDGAVAQVQKRIENVYSKTGKKIVLSELGLTQKGGGTEAQMEEFVKKVGKYLDSSDHVLAWALSAVFAYGNGWDNYLNSQMAFYNNDGSLRDLAYMFMSDSF